MLTAKETELEQPERLAYLKDENPSYTKEWERLRDKLWTNKEMKLVNEIIGLYAFDNDYPIVRCLGDVELLNNEYELMQSTGLHDKYGVEIFEGDILKIKDSRLAVYVVEWHKDKFTWVLRYQKDKNQYFPFYNVTGAFFEEIEVIGNIWEDGEILDDK